MTDPLNKMEQQAEPVAIAFRSGTKQFGYATIIRKLPAHKNLPLGDTPLYAAPIMSPASTDSQDVSQKGGGSDTSEVGDAWQPIATAPKGRKLIVGYPNKLGNWRTVMACYYEEGTLPMADDYQGDEEWAAPGWYEECESNDQEIFACDEEPTHWQPLPPPPLALRSGRTT